MAYRGNGAIILIEVGCLRTGGNMGRFDTTFFSNIYLDVITKQSEVFIAEDDLS